MVTMLHLASFSVCGNCSFFLYTATATVILSTEQAAYVDASGWIYSQVGTTAFHTRVLLTAANPAELTTPNTIG